MSYLSNFFAEVRRRRVLRVAALYIVGAWVLLQVADLALESLGFPDQALGFFWVAIFSGFPLALFFGWRYDLTAQGIARTPPAHPGIRPDLSLKTPDYLILSAFVLVAGIAILGIVDELAKIETGTGTTPVQPLAQNTIAVLPLINLSGDPNQEYFSAGIHDSLITALSQISSLRVTSKTSATRIDKSYSMAQISSALGVAKIIDGTVTREGDKVRINVQLIDAAADEHLWAESYERDFTSMLSLQNEIARAIARAVQAKIRPEEEVRLLTGQTINPDTYDAYLRGMFQLHKETPEGYRRGIEIMSAAVENDPTSALTYAGLAYGHAKLGHNAFGVTGAAPRAKAAASRALELDDSLAEAHLAMGMYYLYYEWDWENTEKYLFKAIELNPSLTFAHYHLAWYYELIHDSEKALAYGEITRDLDPLSPFYTGWLADQYRNAGLYEKALAEAKATVEFTPGFPVGWFVLGMIYAETGEFDKAIAAHEHLRDDPLMSWILGATYAIAGQPDKALKIIEQYGEDRRAALARVIIYAALRDKEQVYTWMKITKEEKLAWYPWLITWFPQGKFMHDEPRWQEYAKELNLELPES